MLLVAVALACLALATKPPQKSVLLVPSPEVYDFGEVKRGDLDGEFALTNESEKPIQILHVLVTCTCQKVGVPRKRLEPGQSVQGRFRWDTRRERGESQTHFDVVYKVVGEDEMRQTRCVCRGNVIAPYALEPEGFSFSSATKEVQTATVRFWPLDKSDLKVTGATCLHAAFSAKCDAAKNEVIVSFDPSKWHEHDADFDHQVRVRTSSDAGFDCLVPVRFRE